MSGSYWIMLTVFFTVLSLIFFVFLKKRLDQKKDRAILWLIGVVLWYAAVGVLHWALLPPENAWLASVLSESPWVWSVVILSIIVVSGCGFFLMWIAANPREGQIHNEWH